jgi:tRNA A37 methylthiotransferase MiaB
MTTAPTPSAARAAASERSRPSVAFISLGCPKNLVDSEKMLGALAASGCRIVSSDEAADAIIINTCGFLEASKDESLAVIHEALEAKRQGRVKRVVVAGCLVQRHRAKMLEWAPGIDAMIGVFDRDHVIEAVGGQREAASRGRGPVSDPDRPRYWIAANALQAARARGLATTGLTVNGADGHGVGYFEDDSQRFRLTPRHWAYLRISEGCNQKCAFCTIPSIRGKMRSKPLDRIIAEARQLIADGAFELNLIGQDTTSYGMDIHGSDRRSAVSPQSSARSTQQSALDSYSGDLIGLLEALNDVVGGHRSTGGQAGPRSGTPSGAGAGAGAAASGASGASGGSGGSGGGGILSTQHSALSTPPGGWVRLMYVYPTHFTDAMIDAIARLPGVVKYIDIPLQHMSDRMLSAMRRNITRARQEELLNKLRERIPGVAIRTTFITGFPGETPADHAELLEFIRSFGFDMMGVFRYSREDGTPAGTMDRNPALHVPDDVKAGREQELMLAQQEIAFENARYLAEQRCQFDVLIDAPPGSEPGRTKGRSTSGVVNAGALYIGRCYHQAPQVDSVTYVHSTEPLAPGELVRCTIVDSDGYDLIARPTVQLETRVKLPVVRRM